ncbi:MAG: crossover junction endodeoxyribonuclease RuvC [Bacteroidota bacterium]|nr:crossover junction endodeoxyribonuclease RuvC [Bacteroidota bacterium]
MIILGVDPGTLLTGYGVIERNGTTTRVLASGVIKNLPAQLMPLRLQKIYLELAALIEKFHPDEFAIETAFYGKNAQSALKIGQARGVSVLAGVNYEVPVTEYSPREVKKAVVGNGAASKDQVQYMVVKILKLKSAPHYLDATDALAVALCHSHRIGKPRTGFKDWRSYVEAHPERVVKPLMKIKGEK